MINDCNTGLLLVGHGTRDDEGTRQFFLLADVLGRHISPIPVQPCLLELQPPTIEEGWNLLANQGVQHVHVAPLLLFSAGHAKQDIPQAVSAAAAATPQISFDVGRPLSRHAAVICLANQRIKSLLSHCAPDQATTIVTVGRGSYDPCARSDMFVLSEILRHNLNKDRAIDQPIDVVTGFYAMAEPRLPDVLDAICRTSGSKNVIVYAHLLFAGRLYQAIEQQAQAAAEKFPDISISVCDYLGPDPLLAQAIWDRATAQLPSVGVNSA